MKWTLLYLGVGLLILPFTLVVMYYIVGIWLWYCDAIVGWLT